MRDAAAANRRAKRDVIVISDDEAKSEQPAEKSARRETESPLQQFSSAAESECAELRRKLLESDQKLLESDEKLAKSEQKFQRLCAMAGEHKARAQFLENIIDTKPNIVGDANKDRKIAELEKKVIDLSKQLEKERNGRIIDNERNEERISYLEYQLDEERKSRMKDLDTLNELSDELEDGEIPPSTHENAGVESTGYSTNLLVAAQKEEPAVVKKATVSEPERKSTVSAELISDQEKRREEEHKKTLFIKGFDRHYNEDKIKALHVLIIDVRRRNNKAGFAWVTFASEADAKKAYSDLSKVKGLTVDYCGQKSKTHTALIENKSAARPIDPTLLCVRNIAGAITVAELKSIFKTASDVKIPAKSRKAKAQMDKYALVRFESEEEARSVFNANKGLKINGAPATVMFAFARAPVEKEEPPKQIEKMADAPSNQFVEESDDEESDDYEEEIEEEDDDCDE